MIKPIGYLMALSGLAYLAQGWVLGSEGFSAHNAAPTLLGIILVFVWTTWFLLTAWRSRSLGAERTVPDPASRRCSQPPRPARLLQSRSAGASPGSLVA